jgi:hypothetical protein
MPRLIIPWIHLLRQCHVMVANPRLSVYSFEWYREVARVRDASGAVPRF